MTPEKIAKLRNMALRGTPGEVQAAKHILAQAGVDWRTPTPPVMDTVKSFFGADITRRFDVAIEHATDMVLMQILLNAFCKRVHSIHMVEAGKMRVVATRTEMKQIMAVFSKRRKEMATKLYMHGKIILNFNV
jgi:hypothetical protein